MGLLACPFCREMFEHGEAKTCPVCGMALAKFEDLPPSIEATHDEGGVPTAPEMEVLQWRDLGRGKGIVVGLAAVGMVLFFLPWVHLTLPYIDSKSGFTLAHERIGWAWAAFVGWSVLVPTVMSRRTIAALRGARVAAAFLSAFPGLVAALLLARPPKGTVIKVVFEWQWPIYAVIVVSVLAVFFSLRLGGRVDDIKLAKGTSRGQMLH